MSGTVELQSSSYLKACSGRPEFQIRMSRGWKGLQKYHVVGLKNGMLLLNLGATASTTGQFDGSLGLVGGIMGGKLGGLLGSALEKAGESTLAMADNNFSICSDDELIKKAKGKEYKGSLVAAYDDFISVSIDQRSATDAWTRGGVVAALISIREKSLGKMTWEICDQQSLVTVCEFLPAKLGDKVQCNIELDPESLKWVRSKS